MLVLKTGRILSWITNTHLIKCQQVQANHKSNLAILI